MGEVEAGSLRSLDSRRRLSPHEFSYGSALTRMTYRRWAIQPLLRKRYSSTESAQKNTEATRNLRSRMERVANKEMPAHASTISNALPRTSSE